MEGAVPIVMITHEALESDVRKALAELNEMNIIHGPTKLIRIEGSAADSSFQS